MHTARTCGIVAAAAMVFACGGTLASARLQSETPTTLRIGETAALQVPSDRHYSIGSAGRSLTLVKQMQQHDTTTYIYRAIDVGDQTLVATPRDPGPGGCISCVTVHYFVRVTR
jgi:hypothetical protein